MFYDSSFVFHSHSVSIGREFGLSFTHQRISNRHCPYFFYIRGSRECNFFRKIFPWQLLSPYVLPDFYVAKFLCWNIFVGRRAYKNFSTRKFFQQKFHITKISRFTVILYTYIRNTIVVLIKTIESWIIANLASTRLDSQKNSRTMQISLLG